MDSWWFMRCSFQQLFRFIFPFAFFTAVSSRISILIQKLRKLKILREEFVLQIYCFWYWLRCIPVIYIYALTWTNLVLGNINIKLAETVKMVTRNFFYQYKTKISFSANKFGCNFKEKLVQTRLQSFRRYVVYYNQSEAWLFWK